METSETNTTNSTTPTPVADMTTSTAGVTQNKSNWPLWAVLGGVLGGLLLLAIMPFLIYSLFFTKTVVIDTDDDNPPVSAPIDDEDEEETEDEEEEAPVSSKSVTGIVSSYVNEDTDAYLQFTTLFPQDVTVTGGVEDTEKSGMYYEQVTIEDKYMRMKISAVYEDSDNGFSTYEQVPGTKYIGKVYRVTIRTPKVANQYMYSSDVSRDEKCYDMGDQEIVPPCGSGLVHVATQGTVDGYEFGISCDVKDDSFGLEVCDTAIKNLRGNWVKN